MPYPLKALSIALLISLFLVSAAVAQQQQEPRTPAAPGDSVWVIVNSVKPDKRTQFEKFVNEVFWPAAKKLTPAEQQIFRQTRVLYSGRPEKDGTYEYVFIMDPVMPGQDYDIERLLQKMFTAEKAAAYTKMFQETLAGEQKWYRMVQSRL
ncbi:hypothetical protein [Hymenobacter sp. DG25A]|uniref:hypothetical protein n=1 Tax=Hymenobacter sp. DG25A TaxID=1385663 RepID=UPI0006BCD0A2|nr:hypothetical protein [Hymenobacter sp. DG25A]ALD21331.1 hypothetical protein AM218_09020 [Hymenobacter sp. DG25A]